MNREAAPDELSCELFCPCEGHVLGQGGRLVMRGPFGKIGVRSLPSVHPFIALPIEVWGPPWTRATLRLQIERPGSRPIEEPARKIEIAFDSSGVLNVGASVDRLELREEGIHGFVLLAGERVLARRRILVRVVEPWEQPSGDIPSGM